MAVLCLLSPMAAANAQVVVVTGSREPLPVERLAADVAVIDADTLRFTTADSLADLLRREAGMQVSRNGGPGQSSGLFIRGTASQQSVVLVDGVRIGSATLGYAAVETLGLAQLERVEVLRGPGSSLYGADAVGGVVNLITRRGSGEAQAQAQTQARLAVGGHGSREASLGVRGAAGAVDYSLSLWDERSDGVSALRPGDRFGNYNPDRDGFRLDSLQAAVGVRPATGHRIGVQWLRTKLNSQYDASEFLPPSYAQNASADFRTRVTTTVSALDWRGALAQGLSGSARLSSSEDDALSGGSQLDRFRTLREQAEAQLVWRSADLGQWVAALESKQEQAQSTSYVSSVKRRNQALVLEWTGSARALSWQSDLRRDDSSDFGAVTTGRLGASLKLMPGLRLRALAGTTFRAPSFNDLYYPGYGVSSLRPERGQSMEMGLDWSADSASASATVYRNRVRDLVGYESNPARCPAGGAYSFGCAGNTGRAQLQGATLSAAQRLGAWALKTQLDFLEARDRDTGQRLARRAAHQATLGADWSAGDWRAGASLLRVGERPDGGKRLAAETTLDLVASWRMAPGWWLQAKLINASDERLEPARDYQGLGRQAWLVLRMER